MTKSVAVQCRADGTSPFLSKGFLVSLPRSLSLSGRLIGAAVACSVALLAAVVPQAHAATPTSRAMWVWNWSSNADVISFAQSHGVTELFAYTAPGWSTPGYIPPGWSQPELPLITDLSARAHAAGIKIDAMGGDPSWAQNVPVAQSWATENVDSGLFDGLHVELEPWQLSAWTTDQAATIAGFLSDFDVIKSAAGSMQVEASIPWWLYQYYDANGTTLDKAVMNRVDSAAVITFHNTPATQEQDGSTESADAVSLGKPFRYASETNQSNPTWVSYYGSTETQFETAMNQVDADMANTTGYRGMAVEDYNGWVALQAASPAPAAPATATPAPTTTAAAPAAFTQSLDLRIGDAVLTAGSGEHVQSSDYTDSQPGNQAAPQQRPLEALVGGKVGNVLRTLRFDAGSWAIDPGQGTRA